MFQLTKSMKLTKEEMGRKSPWSMIVWFILTGVVSSLVLGILLGPILVILSSGQALTGAEIESKYGLLVNMLTFPVQLICLLLVNKYYYKKSFASLGFFKEQRVTKYLKGMLIGGGALFVVYLLNLLFGTVTTVFNTQTNFFTILVLLLAFGVQGMTEEVLARSLLMNMFSARKGVVFGILLNSLLFAGLHLMNPGLTVLSFVNLFLFGLLFSLLFYWSDNIWLTGAAHSLWNFVMGPILGIEVSGLVIRRPMFITTSLPGKEWLNGGNFGLEGGIFTTVFGVVACLVLLKLCQNKELIQKK